jgi:hypothetical protein
MLLLTRMRDTALPRSLLWRWSARGVWLGPVAFALSLLGMELLRRESLRIWAVLLLLSAGVVAVLAWNSSRWSDALPADWGTRLAQAQLQVWRRRCALATLAGAVFLSALSHLAFLAAPHETFGAAGWLWLAGIAVVIAAAIAGASIMAFSAANMHYSRMALNNITTPFFWAVCFFFIMRGLRRRRPTDWTLAGVAAGVSEHFYYGTRLLSFILIAFVVYLLVVHWSAARRYLGDIGWLILGYLVGFGPLLSYFVTHPGLYYGRGAGLMTWNRIPASWHDIQQMWSTLRPIMSENLLGISTHSAQDIMYYAPLLLAAEAALLVLGVALLVWRWQHPAAFLVLLSGLAVLFVGGRLILYPNSSPPMPAHWTPAFPAFYAAIAVPVGAWVESADVWLHGRQRWITAAIVVAGLVTLACANINFYFYRYYAHPESLRNERYRAAQRLYEVQTTQSRYMATLGPAYRVVVVGQSPYPYDRETTRYLVARQEYVTIRDPLRELSLLPMAGKGLAFLFFPGSEQYRGIIHERYTGGMEEEVRNPVGRHVFYSYVIKPQIIGSDSQPR